MPHDDEMTIDERLKYLRRMRSRYLQADKRGRGRLLTASFPLQVAEIGSTMLTA